MFDCKKQKFQNINDLKKMEVYISVARTKSRNEQTRVQITDQGSDGHIHVCADKTRLAFPPAFAPPPLTSIDCSSPGLIPPDPP